jgi:hypothetical protein
VAVALGAAASTTACTTHQCDALWVDIDQSTGMTIGDVQVLAPGYAMWESSPMDGTWIDFPGQRTYFFTLPQDFTPAGPPEAFLGTTQTAGDVDAGGGTYVPAAGQLAEFGPYGNQGFNVENGSCAEYFLYVRIFGTIPTAPTGTTGNDAGDDAAAGH